MNGDQELIEIERTLWMNDAEIYSRTFLPDAVIISRQDPGVFRRIRAQRRERRTGGDGGRHRLENSRTSSARRAKARH
jgi:hypothetical protein